MSGTLKKLIIESFKDEKMSGSPTATFTAMYNPASYSVKYSVEYEEDQGRGTSGSPQKFKKVKPVDFGIDIIIDGTGASGKKEDEVIKQVRHFLKVVYEFEGEIHRPKFLKVVWGTLLFNCVFKGANVKYTLFKPDGSPLRATISATFNGSVDDTKRVAEEKKKSPDLARYHTVIKGDTLPLLAFKYYGDPRYFLEVARVNKLDNFRMLSSGQQLLFPPLSKKTSKKSSKSKAA